MELVYSTAIAGKSEKNSSIWVANKKLSHKTGVKN